MILSLSLGVGAVRAVLLLLARDQPLSAADTADLGRLLAPRPLPLTDPMMALWLENGERVADRAPILGKGQASGDAEHQVRLLMRQVKDRFGYNRAVCFGNRGTRK